MVGIAAEERAPSPAELERIADEILAADLRSELCRECDRRGVALGPPVMLVILSRDGEDTGARAESARFVCEQGHVWHAGEGKSRGRGGESPILLAEHMKKRKARETYMADGVVSEWVKPGMFHRDHVERPSKSAPDDS